MTKNVFCNLFNYIADLVYTGLPSFQFLKGLLTDLGLEISQKKLVPLDTSVICLGIQSNTIDRTISIPTKTY